MKKHDRRYTGFIDLAGSMCYTYTWLRSVTGISTFRGGISNLRWIDWDYVDNSYFFKITFEI